MGVMRKEKTMVKKAHTIATKEEESSAIVKIEQILKELGPDSYVGAALEGCLDMARSNIQNDWMDSPKEWEASLQQQNENLRTKMQEQKTCIEYLEKEKKKLEKRLEFELELKEYENPQEFPQKAYDKLRANCKEILPDEACWKMIQRYGFDPVMALIERTKPVYLIDRHKALHCNGTVPREPLYFASDWNYLRFSTGGYTWEIYDGELHMV